jgi:hypothetical protein
MLLRYLRNTLFHRSALVVGPVPFPDIVITEASARFVIMLMSHHDRSNAATPRPTRSTYTALHRSDSRQSPKYSIQKPIDCFTNECLYIMCVWTVIDSQTHLGVQKSTI